MDVMMPNMSGVEATREIRTFSTVPILFLTARSLDSDNVGGVGQSALPVGRQLVPFPVAVVNQSVIGDIIQHVDMLRRGHPQQRGVEAVPGGLLPHESALAAMLGPEEGAELLAHAEQQGRQGVYRHIWAHFPAVFLPGAVVPTGGGGKI
jgi:CheY-like chemotaxis protein